MPLSIQQNSFAGGEISPALWGRTDLAKYRSGAAFMRNFFVDYRGGAVSRPGSLYIGMGQSTAAAAPRVVPFIFNDEQTYVLEFSTKPNGDPRLRVIDRGSYQTTTGVNITAVTRGSTTTITAAGHGLTTQDDFYVTGITGLLRPNGLPGLNGRQLRVSGTSGNNVTASSEFASAIVSTDWTAWSSGGQILPIYSVDVPWAADVFFELNFEQQGDVVTVTHPDYRSYTISRLVDGTWSVDAETFGSSLSPPTGLAATAINNDGDDDQLFYAYVLTTYDPLGLDESQASSIITVNNRALDQVGGVTNKITWTAQAGTGLLYRIYKAPVVPVGTSSSDQGVWGLIGETEAAEFQDINYAPDYTRSPPKSFNPFAEGSVTEITLTAGGQGHIAPQVSVTIGSGASIIANARPSGPGDDGITDPFGEITSLTLVNGGQAYTTASTASIADTVTALGSGAVLAFDGNWVDLGGGNYAPAPGSITITNGGMNYHRFASTGILASPTVGVLGISDLGDVEDTGNDGQSNFSFGSFGATAADRYLIALITTRDATADFSASSITIGGVTATIAVDVGIVGDTTTAIIAYALVPTGASGSVVVNWSESIANDQICTLLRVTGLGTLVDTANPNASSSASSISGALDVPAGGLIVAVSAAAGNATATWSLSTEVSDVNASDGNHCHSAAYETFGTASTPETVTVTWASGRTDRCMAIASFGSVSSTALPIATTISGGVITELEFSSNTPIATTTSAGLTFVITDLGPTGATATVETGSANNPRCVAYFQQRKVYAGGAAPRGFFMSRPGQFTNFDYSYPSQDVDPIIGYVVGSDVNEILSLVPMPNGMIAFTSSTAFLISGGSSRGAITPSNATAVPQSTIGAAPLAPIVIGNDILYLQSRGSAVSSLHYDFYRDGLTGDDLSQLAQHLLPKDATIVDWAWAREPWRVLWAVRDDGILLSFTYVPEQEVYGWAHHDTLGRVVSVCSVPECSENAVYIVTERPFGSGTPYYVTERLASRMLNGNLAANMPTTTEDAWCVDDGVQFPLTYPAGTLNVVTVYDPGQITDLTIVEGGDDYPDEVTVSVNDPTGSGAIIEATVTDGKITALTIINGGSFYSNPTIEFYADGLLLDLGAEIDIELQNIFVFGTSGVSVGSSDIGKHLRFGGGVGTVIAGNTTASQITVNMEVMPHSFYPNDQRIPTRYTRSSYASGSWSLTTPVAVIGGLDHLVGAYVTGVADGVVIPSQYVTALGSITLEAPASAVIVGVGFTAQLMTLRLEDPGGGTIQGRRKDLPAATLRTVDTARVKMGPRFDMLQEVQLDTDVDGVEPSIGAPFSQRGGGYPLATSVAYGAYAVTPIWYNDYRVNMDLNWNPNGIVCIEQDLPLPATILDVIPLVNIGDDEDRGDA